MMVTACGQKNRAGVVPLRHLESKHIAIEFHGALQVGYREMDVSDSHVRMNRTIHSFTISSITSCNCQSLASQPGGIFGGEKYCRRGDILRLANSSQRSLSLDLLAHVALGNTCSMDSFSLNHPRVDGIDPYSARTQLF